jgi:hypothetical protein
VGAVFLNLPTSSESLYEALPRLLSIPRSLRSLVSLRLPSEAVASIFSHKAKPGLAEVTQVYGYSPLP